MTNGYDQDTASEIEHLRQWELELFKSAITAGQGASRAILLLSGGGAAAMLAFMGPLFRGNATHASFSVNLCLPLGFFVASALCATANAGLMWVCQAYFRATQQTSHKLYMQYIRSNRNGERLDAYLAHERTRCTKERRVLWVTAFFWLCSFCLFGAGAYFAGQAIRAQEAQRVTSQRHVIHIAPSMHDHLAHAKHNCA
ncbi:hypothetical protein GGQ74_000064 [Desulfobaculum xiamenense]|uniref:Uncharacterized protein n=1 Tax=Desulfobaculum xiamenense TaxID=995050 RepID=A0A846QME8_9BACT|nr:hypothetical protein [Desulfobaculum xiamenense]NJB66424.1 hypothetical protein [Desulfobaculum xiamenense]